jgi:adenylate cyclase
MIELLAGAVSEAIARLEREAEVDRRRSLLDRAGSDRLQPNAPPFHREQREVTLLFADLRGSTELSCALEIDEHYELLAQVMDCFTAAVMDHDGLVIDYYGDGLAAMWNAPADQAEHAELACRAALRIVETLPDIAADWAELIHRDLPLGIGVHTGIVQVGNAGSARRIKYGPRGQHVHVASRVEGAAKELSVPLLVTEQSVERLSNQLVAQRICRARLRGMKQPLNLFTVHSTATDADLSAAWDIYHVALHLFEQGKLREAAEKLQSIDAAVSGVPARFLAEQVQLQLGRQQHRRSTDRRGSDDGAVITLGGK